MEGDRGLRRNTHTEKERQREILGNDSAEGQKEKNERKANHPRALR